MRWITSFTHKHILAICLLNIVVITRCSAEHDHLSRHHGSNTTRPQSNMPLLSLPSTAQTRGACSYEEATATVLLRTLITEYKRLRNRSRPLARYWLITAFKMGGASPKFQLHHKTNRIGVCSLRPATEIDTNTGRVAFSAPSAMYCHATFVRY